jgi:hypothetical protein
VVGTNLDTVGCHHDLLIHFFTSPLFSRAETLDAPHELGSCGFYFVKEKLSGRRLGSWPGADFVVHPTAAVRAGRSEFLIFLEIIKVTG